MEFTTIFDDKNGLSAEGVEQILNPADIKNGLGPPDPAGRRRRSETDKGAAARATLQVAFTGTFTARKAYPGFKARHPDKPCPVGKAWPEIGGQRYNFAEGVDAAEYPVRDSPYHFFIEGEGLAFDRISVVTSTSGFTANISPAWRLVGR